MDQATAPDFPELQDLERKSVSTNPTAWTGAEPPRPATADPSVDALASDDQPTQDAGTSDFKLQIGASDRRLAGPKSAIAKPNAPQRPAAAAPAARSRRKSNPLALVVVGGSLALTVVLSAIFVVAFWHSRDGARGRGPTSLVLTWPESERSGAAATIDGQRLALPKSGSIVVEVTPGQHSLVLQRRGYEVIEHGFSVAAGEKFTFAPKWVALNAPNEGGFGGIRPLPGSPPDRTGDVPSSGGTASGPVGFNGWLQSLEIAQRNAVKQRKDILLVFAGSDWSQASISMTERLFSKAEFRSFADPRFVTLVIDVPRTEAGFNQLENAAQNRELVERFGVAQVPVVALLDSDARPFAIDGVFEDNIERYIQHLNRLATYRQVRNDLFAAANRSTLPNDQRLSKAEEAVNWLRDQRLLRHYYPELMAWTRLARTLDPQNQQGKLEVFFEAEWLVQLTRLAAERRIAPIKQQLDDLLAWSEQHTFVDPDRAVRLHLAAFQLSARLRDDSAAAKHVDQAAKFTPRDAALVRELNDAKRAAASSNQLSSGTAFVIDARGYLLTNHHVVEGPGVTVVRLPGRQDTVAAELVAKDPQRDMALLKIDPAPLGALRPLAFSRDKIKRASSVAVFGFPLGDDIARDIRITTGVVSALPDQSEEKMLLLDCRINPGNSGGPVLQRNGLVIGMITAKTTGGIGVDSYGMALPTDDLLQFLAQHVPDFAPAGDTIPPAREWVQIDEDVTAGNSVLMVLKVRL